jgi:hypothetical protein
MERRAMFGLSLLVALLVGLFLGAALPRAESANAVGPGRYETANFSGIGLSVLDTHTGAVWSFRIAGDGPNRWRQLAPGIPQ